MIAPTNIGEQPVVSSVVPTSVSQMLPTPKAQLDVTDLGKWIGRQVEYTVGNRRDAEVDWLKVRHILNGHHNLIFDAMLGTVTPDLTIDDDEVRAHTNMMLNRYKRERGRRLSVSIKANVLPRRHSSQKAFYLARRGNLALRQWREETKFDAIYDLFVQMILRMDLAAFLVEPSFDNSTAHVSVISGADLLPLPGTASTTQNAEGIVYRKFLSEAYLQEQVQQQKLPPDIMTAVGKHSTMDGVGSPFVSWGMSLSRTDIKGAVGLFFYLKPSSQWPSGMHGLAIGEKIYAVHMGRDGQPTMPLGGPPIPVWDNKTDGDWYGESFCTALVGLNLEDDRQLSNEIAMAEVNRHGGWTLVPENFISMNDMQVQLGGFLTYRTSQLGLDKSDPVVQVAPPPLSRETTLVSARLERQADETASHYDVSRGEPPGRLESDVALERLLSQTDMPNEPFFKDTRSALREVFERVLDVLHVTWPEEKWISVINDLDLPQEINVQKSEMPGTQDVRVIVGQLVPSSRMATLGLLNNLRERQDITADQYKRALVINGLEPEGIQLENSEEQFAISKIVWIYNDGQQPREWPYQDDFDLEPHPTMVRMIKRFVTTMEYKMDTGPGVKQAMHQELRKHQLKLAGEPGRTRTDSQYQEEDTGRFERTVSAEEAQLGPENATLVTNPDGRPYG